MKELYDKIESYLTDELSAEERSSFEQAMAADADLRAEVRLHQKMATVFEDPQAFRLRKELQQAGDNFEWPTEKGTSRSIRYLYWASAIAAVLAGVIFFFSPPTKERDEPIISDQIISTPIDTVLNPPTREKLAEEPVIKQEQTPAPNTTTPPVETPIINTPTDLLAQNTAIEALITRYEPRQQYDFELSVQAIETGTSDNPQGHFFLEGEVYATALPADSLFHLAVYDNNPDRFPGDPIISTALQPIIAEEEVPLAFAAKQAFSLLFVGDLPVFPARYYYLIRVLGEEAPVAVGVVD